MPISEYSIHITFWIRDLQHVLSISLMTIRNCETIEIYKLLTKVFFASRNVK